MPTTMLKNLKSLNDTPLTCYYNTLFDQNDVHSAYDLQSQVLKTSYTATRLINLSVSPEILTNLTPFDVVLNTSCMIINGHCQQFDLVSLLEHITPSSNVLINIPAHPRLIDFWFTILQNTNAIVWTALPKDSYDNEFKSRHIHMLDCIPLESMFNFSREIFILFDLIQIQFCPSFEFLSDLTVDFIGHITTYGDCNVSCDFLFDRFVKYLRHFSELRSGDLAFYFFCDFFSLCRNRTSVLAPNTKAILINILRTLMMPVSMQLDNAILSIHGSASIIRDITLTTVRESDFDLIVHTFRHKYLTLNERSLQIIRKSLSLYCVDDYSVMILDAMLRCFSIHLSTATEIIRTYSNYDDRQFLSALLRQYHAELLLSIDIESHMSPFWVKLYTGEGFVSILVALYMSRLEKSIFVLSYAASVRLTLDAACILYCSSQSNDLFIKDKLSLDSTDLMSLYTEDSEGLVTTTHNGRYITLKPYKYVYSPLSDDERANNAILDYIARYNTKGLIRCPVSMISEAEFCNQNLTACLTISSLNAYSKPDLIAFNNIATYFCYFPNRTFPREVMYYGRKTDSLAIFAYTQSFDSKFTNMVVRYTCTPCKLTFCSKHLGTSEFTSWYYRGDIFEYCGNLTYKYSVSYPKLPLKVEEYVQHKYLGYVSPLRELNDACYSLICTLANMTAPYRTGDAYHEVYSQFKLSSHLELEPELDAHAFSKLSADESTALVLRTLQSLFNRHNLTSLINDAYKGTGHVLIVRPLILMAHQSEASCTVKTASGDPFNMHHSLLTENGNVEYVCRVCGNIGTSQYIVRICEFINSMDISSFGHNHRLRSCYSEYLDYESYTSSGPLSIKTLRSLRFPTQLKVNGIVLTNSYYHTSSFHNVASSLDVAEIDISAILIFGAPIIDRTCFHLTDFFSIWARSFQAFSDILSDHGYHGLVFDDGDKFVSPRRSRLVHFDSYAHSSSNSSD